MNMLSLVNLINIKLNKIMKVADISQRDIDLSDKRGYSKLDLDTARTLSGNPTLTQQELEQLKKAAKDKQELKPTGIFAE